VGYISLYRKYRPETFDEILGQEPISSTLARAVSEDRVAHAYLFTGPRGTGKTSTARILAKALNCAEGPTSRPCGRCPSCIAITEGSSLDVIEMDAASHSKVDETREILAGVPLATAGGLRKVYVIDEVHMLSAPSFNALLKTLEEPPAHVLFVLATTEAHKVLSTIISRTQRFDFRRLPADLLQDHLAHVAKLEGIEAEAEALGVIARHADGSARDALSVLDQLASLGRPIQATDVERLLGERPEDAFIAVFEAIARSEVGRLFSLLHSLVAEGADARQLAVGALGHARSLLLLRTAPEAEGMLDVAPEDGPRLLEQAQMFSPGDLLRVMDLLGKSLTEMRNIPNHRLLLELALVRAAAPETDPSANGLLGRIERLERRLGIAQQISDEARRQGADATPTGGAAAPEVTTSDPALPDGADSLTREEDGGRESRGGVSAQAPDGGTGGAQDRGRGVAEERSPDRDRPGDARPEGDSVRRDDAREAVGVEHIGLNHIKDAWQPILKEVSRRSKRVWGLLTPSQPAVYEDGVLTVEVQSEFHQSTMAMERNRDTLSDAVHAALGIRPALSFEVRSQGASSRQTAESVDLVADARPIEEREDPIELVKKGFRAEVVEESEA
jgi:DNA polymerase-3 subunit gamma/tau